MMQRQEFVTPAKAGAYTLDPGLRRDDEEKR